MPQKKLVAKGIFVFDFELFIGLHLPRLFVVVLLALDKRNKSVIIIALLSVSTSDCQQIGQFSTLKVFGDFI